MGFENTTTIAGLNELWPLGTDPRSEGDDHLREIKKVLKTEFPKGGVTNTAQARSRIVNGAMQVSQENGFTGSANLTALTYYAADQFVAVSSTSPGTANALLVAAVTPNGSKNRFRVVVGTAKAALAAGDLLDITTKIEGGRVADFRYGSASAKQAILRFGWKSPAGTYSVVLLNSANNRSYIANFTISAANTDTEQSIVIPGDVTGTWLVDTGVGMELRFGLAAGTTYQGVTGWQAGNFVGTAATTNGMATAANTFELWDVGLYLDADATGLPPKWTMPDEARELMACMRYYEYNSGINVIQTNTYASYDFKVVKRIGPSMASNVGTLTGVVAGLNSFQVSNGSTVNFTWTANARM